MIECSMIMNVTDQALKLSFLYTFVNWGRVYLEDHFLSLFDFIE